jgi:hypothetical protein
VSENQGDFTISGLARLLEKDRATIKRRLAGVEPAGIVRGHPVFRLVDALAALDDTPDDDGGDGERRELLRQKIRVERAKADALERENKVRTGELLSLAEAQAADAIMATAIRDNLLALPDAVAPDVCEAVERDGQVGAAEALRRAIEDALNATADAALAAAANPRVDATDAP